MPAEMAGLHMASPKQSKPGGRQKRPRVSEENRRRAMRACDSCRRQKEKCEGGVPCHRCSRLHRMCQFHMSTTSGGHILVSEDKRAVAEPDISGTNEKMEYMERIIKHFIGDIPCDTSDLRRIAETLHNENSEPDGSIANEEADDTEGLEIADEDFTVNALSNNTAHYSGEFSHWSFSKRVQQRIDKLAAGEDPIQHEPSCIKQYFRAKWLQSSGSTLLTVVQWFPPHPVSEFLISSFFKYGQTNYYYVEEDWAKAKLESIYRQSSTASSDDSPVWCILLMLLAIGTQFADLDSTDITAAEPPNNSASNPEVSSEDEVGLTFYRIAVRLIPDVMTIASIESIQAFLLLAVYTLPLDPSGLSYTYLGVAMKMAIQNGLHRKHPGQGLAPHTVKIRNRLWWTVYTLEKRICILHGRPASISNSDTDTEAPDDIDDFRLSYKPFNFANIQAMIRLTTQLDSIALSIKKLRSSPRISQAGCLEELIKHSQNFKEWWLSLPTEVYCRDLDPEKSMFRANIHLNLTFRLTQVFMGRPFLFTYSNVSASSDQSMESKAYIARFALISDCVEAAYQILDLCRLLRDNRSLARTSYTEFSSCHAALLVLLAHSLNEGTERLRNSVTGGMQLMRLMAGGMGSAKSDLLVIENLERAVTRLEARSRSQTVNNDHGQSSGYEKYKSWAQLWKQSPITFEGAFETAQQSTASRNSYEIAEFSGASMETDTSEFAVDGFFAFPQVMEGFDVFPIADDSFQQTLGSFPI